MLVYKLSVKWVEAIFDKKGKKKRVKGFKEAKRSNSLFAVGFEASSTHLIESYTVVLFPINLLHLECFTTFFKLTDLKLKCLKLLFI